ncbi:MAG: MBL fold metallo-hydrolase [Candidatus Bathyarchaeia archaeon]
MRLTFFGGVGEIGGNKVLVEDRGTKFFLDFGQSFTRGNDYFLGFLQPRAINGAGDYFEFGLLPEVPGLYAEQMLQNTKLRYVEPEVQAILLSHAHVDHVGHLGFIDPQIPVYLGETAKLVLDAMRETSPSWDLNEHAYRMFRTGDRIRVDSFEVEPIHVDHSIPGAYGFLIHAADHTFVYTGDLRRHGPLAAMTDEFLERASQAKPDLLICEGTRVEGADQFQSNSEGEVFNRSRGVVSRTKGLVLTSFYGRDIDRVRTLHNVANKTGRTFVVSAKVAFILKALASDPKLRTGDMLKDALVYLRRKATYYRYEKEFAGASVDYEHVQKRQSELMLNLDWANLTELIDIKPRPGGCYIHSMSEPFNEEGEAELRILRNWTRHFGLRLHQCHASGHASPQDLKKIATEIRAQTVFPIHTEKPHRFRDLLAGKSRLRLPQYGKPITITTTS